MLFSVWKEEKPKRWIYKLKQACDLTTKRGRQMILCWKSCLKQPKLICLKSLKLISQAGQAGVCLAGIAGSQLVSSWKVSFSLLKPDQKISLSRVKHPPLSLRWNILAGINNIKIFTRNNLIFTEYFVFYKAAGATIIPNVIQSQSIKKRSSDWLRVKREESTIISFS